MHRSLLKFALVKAAGFLALLTLMTGCTTQTQKPLIPEGAELNLESIRIGAAPAANNGQPVRLDIVYVYNEPFLRKLQGYNSKGWFTVRETDLLDLEGQAVIQGLTIEPGTQVQMTEFPADVDKTVAIALFANYKAPGLHRFFIVGGEKIAVQMEQFGYMVTGE